MLILWADTGIHSRAHKNWLTDAAADDYDTATLLLRKGSVNYEDLLAISDSSRIKPFQHWGSRS